MKVELLEKLEKEEKTEEKIIDQIFLYSLLEKLGKEERQLIYLRYFENKTQSETGKQLGMSQVQVSRHGKENPETDERSNGGSKCPVKEGN